MLDLSEVHTDTWIATFLTFTHINICCCCALTDYSCRPRSLRHSSSHELAPQATLCLHRRYCLCLSNCRIAGAAHYLCTKIRRHCPVELGLNAGEAEDIGASMTVLKSKLRTYRHNSTTTFDLNPFERTADIYDEVCSGHQFHSLTCPCPSIYGMRLSQDTKLSPTRFYHQFSNTSSASTPHQKHQEYEASEAQFLTRTVTPMLT